MIREPGPAPSIRAITIIPVRVPLLVSIFMAGQRFDVADNVLVRCDTAAGITGWGEATSALATTGENPASIRASLDSFVRTTWEAGLRTDEIRRRADVTLAARPAARSALDMALVDVEARHAALPAWRLLSPNEDAPGPPATRHVVLACSLISGASADEEVAQAIDRVADGFRWLKLKIGRRLIEEEAATIMEIRARVGRAVHLGADANEGLTRDSAVRIARLAEPAGLAFIEQPLDRHDVDGLAALRRSTAIPVIVDEGVGTLQDIEQHVAAGALDGAMLKFQKAGGVGALVGAARAAHAMHLGVGFTGKVAESGIAGAALLHAAHAAGPATYGVSLTAYSLAHDLVSSPIRAIRGELRVSDGPGFGVEVDEAAVESARRRARPK